mgnify:FL=1
MEPRQGGFFMLSLIGILKADLGGSSSAARHGQEMNRWSLKPQS